jgi:O-antigen/teichoic acid export membrane protein/LmbE family N-acetylglucosaminyl deacetylase
MISILERLVPGRFMNTARQLNEHLKTPLFANAYLLILNQGLSAGLGMIYWVLAARFYSPDMVGKGSAIISTLSFLSAIAELSLKSGMQRFVSRVGEHVRRLVALTYGVNLAATALVSAGFLIAGAWLHFSDNLLGGMSNTTLVLLILGTMLYTLFIVQDGVLMGLRQTLWVLMENTFYNLLKIVLLIAGISGVLGNAIVASWFIPIPLVVVIVNGLVFFSFIPRYFKVGLSPHEPIQPRQIVRSVTGDHVGTILAEISVRMIPLMVIDLLGTSANAYFYQAWLIGNMLYLVANNVTASFTVEGAIAPAHLAQYSKQTLRQMIFLILPTMLVLFAAAPLILRIYGGEYAQQATPLLRVLALAALPYGVNSWFLSYSRVRSDIKSIIFAQGLQCVLTLGLSYWWMPQYGIASIGAAWFIAQTCIFLVVALKTWRLFFKKSPPEARGFAIDLPMISNPVRPVVSDEGFLSFTPGSTPRINETGGVHLFISPHLDDAVLSCGGYIARLAAAGEKVVIVTFFTADIGQREPVSWLAQRNLRAWNMHSSSTPFAERRVEDQVAASRLGAETLHMGLLDAMYRRKANGEFLYPTSTVEVPIDPEDRSVTGEVLQRMLREVARRFEGSGGISWFVPLGIGGHVDHVLVRDSAEAVFGPDSLAYYEEIPYVARKENRDLLVNGPAQRVAESWTSTSVALTQPEIEARIEAAACYSSQIPGLFPTLLERNLEILTTRAPQAMKALLERQPRLEEPGKLRERVAKTLIEYIQRVGGEKYWRVTSSITGVGEYADIQSSHEK